MFFSIVSAPGRKHVNLLEASRDLQSASWDLKNAVQFVGTEAGPRGEIFDRVRFLNNNAYFFQTLTVTDTDTYTGGLWIKADAVGTVRFVVVGQASLSKGLDINLTTSYQFVQFTDVATGTNRFGIDNRSASGADGTDKNIAFGYCQLNPGSTLEPYRETL